MFYVLKFFFINIKQFIFLLDDLNPSGLRFLGCFYAQWSELSISHFLKFDSDVQCIDYCRSILIEFAWIFGKGSCLCHKNKPFNIRSYISVDACTPNCTVYLNSNVSCSNLVPVKLYSTNLNSFIHLPARKFF